MISMCFKRLMFLEKSMCFKYLNVIYLCSHQQWFSKIHNCSQNLKSSQEEDQKNQVYYYFYLYKKKAKNLCEKKQGNIIILVFQKQLNESHRVVFFDSNLLFCERTPYTYKTVLYLISVKEHVLTIFFSLAVQ